MKWHRHVWLSIFIFIIVLFFGAYSYYHVEGWSMLDSLYFVIITVTTIGYGDLVPITNIGKIYTMFFSFFGVAFAFYMFSLISRRIFEKHLSRKVSQIQKKTEEKEEVEQDIEEIISRKSKKSKRKRKKK